MDVEEKVTVPKTASLMISYSRKDEAFVRKLYDGLVANGFNRDDIWVDWEGIEISEDWMDKITKGIRASNVFVFVISPDSLSSKVCKEEIRLADESNKRFIPILHRQPNEGQELHDKLSAHNWAKMPNEEELEKLLPKLVAAINKDIDWLERHTQLYNKAKEWENKEYNDSVLLRGKLLQDAETFMNESATGKEPPPSPLHAKFVQASQKYAASLRKRNRIITAVVGAVLVGLTIFALIQRGQALTNLYVANTAQVQADNNAATAQANEKIAMTNEAVANENARAANSLALASEAINQKDSDTQLSLMLALLSIQETAQDNLVLLESQSALFSSLNSPNVLHTWETDSIVSAVAYDPNGNYIAIGNADGLMQIVSLDSREQVYSLQFGDEITGLDFDPDGERLGISSADGTAKIVDAASGTELFSLAGHDGYSIYDIDFSPDGKLIATGGGDWYVKLWNADGGSIRVTLPSHTLAVNAVDFSPDSTRLVSGSDDDTVILWDVESNSLLNKFRPDGFETDGKYVASVAFNPTGDRIIASGYQTVVVWDAFAYTELHRLSGNRAKVYDVSFAPDGLSMLTASSGIKIWDYYYGTERYNLSSHRGEVTSAVYSSDGNYILTGSWDNTVKLWSANLLIDSLKIKTNVGQNLDANYSPDGQRIVVSDAWGNIVVYDPMTGSDVASWNTDTWTSQASFDPQDSQRVVTGDDTGKISVWVMGNDQPALSYQAHEGSVYSATFSPDGSRILSAGDDGVIRLWDSQTGDLVSELSYDGELYRARFNQDGSQIVAAGSGNEAHVFDTVSGQKLADLKGHTDLILAVAFSNDGNFVYTAGYDNTVRKWDAKTGTELLVMTGHTGRVFDLNVSPDDSLLVSASADTTVRVWDTRDGKAIFNYRGNNEDANSAVFSPDGKYILTASSDETTKEFTIDYDTLLNIAQEYELRTLTQEECRRFLYRDDCTLTLFGGTAPTTDSSASPATQATPTLAQQPAPQATATSAPAAQAATTSTPASAPVSAGGGSFYTEEFDGGLDSWEGFMVTGTDNQVDMGVDSGSLFVELSPDGDKIPRFYFVNTAFSYSKVQLEAAVTNYGNNANGVSLVCNFDGTNWYEATVSNAGLYSINAYDPTATAEQGYIQLAAGGSGAIKSGQASNKIRFICNENELALYINDTLVKSLVDTKYNLSGGKIGLGVSSPQLLPVEISFETLTVSEP